jgi:prophage regulatory protein
MRLIDFLTTGEQIKTIPKSEIPGLLGEIETLKAQLWARLIELEGLDSVVGFIKTAGDRTQSVGKPSMSVSNQILGPQGRILRIKDVIPLVGLSKSTIWKMVSEGSFPKQRHIGPRSIGWLDTEIYGWIAERFENGN